MSNAESQKGSYIDSAKRGYDPAFRKYRLGVYITFGLALTWFCGGMLLSVVNYLFP